MADIVAKVFLGCRTKILRAADAFYARRREGPYRFIQSRSRISVVALKSDAAAEKPKDQLSRDFLGCSNFDFCNNICQYRKSATALVQGPGRQHISWPCASTNTQETRCDGWSCRSLFARKTLILDQSPR